MGVVIVVVVVGPMLPILMVYRRLSKENCLNERVDKLVLDD